MIEEENNPKRQVSPQRRPEEKQLDGLIRPQQLNDFTGQERLKANLTILIEAAKARQEPLDHVLFHGPPGLGKTTLAQIVANEMQGNIRNTAGPAIERAGDLLAILTNMRAGDILFIDEVHRLGRAVEEVLYPAMEDFVVDFVVGKGPGAKNVRLKLPRFTVIGATTRLALLTAPLRARFGAAYRMDFYDLDAIESIVVRGARILDVPIDEQGAKEISLRARGTPRVALRLLRRVRDYAEVRAQGEITDETAAAALDLLEIDEPGPRRPRSPGPGHHHRQVQRWARRPGYHRRFHQRRVGHDHGRGRALPPAAWFPGANRARPRGHAPCLRPSRFCAAGGQESPAAGAAWTL